MFILPDIKPSEVLIYLRKSRTDDPALTVAETLSKHEQMLDDYCTRTFGQLVPEENRFREVVSGETIAARPEMQKVLHLIEQPKYKAILIVEPQRLSRGDLEDIGRLSKLLRYTRTVVITLQYSYDLDDERDRDYFERELKRGNEYLEYSKRIMANGRALSAERGNYTGSRDPYGYKRVFRKDGKRKFPTLEIVPEEAEIVRMVFSMYADGIGATKICSQLNAIGSVPKLGKLWSPPAIYSMLDNPVYNGKIRHGERRTVKTVEDGEIIVRNPHRKDFQVYEGKHEEIISDTLWSAVRKRREARDLPKVKVSKKLQNPLSGLVFCSCGRMMIRRPYSGRSADRYQCPNQTYCDNASCTMQEMLDAVTSALLNALHDFEASVTADDAGAVDRQSDLRKVLTTRLAELENKERALWEKYAEGMPPKIFDDLIAKNGKQKEEVTAMIEQLDHEPKPINYEERVVLFSETLDVLRDPDAPAAEVNALLKTCIRRITYSRERGKRKRGTRDGWDVKPMNLQIELNL